MNNSLAILVIESDLINKFNYDDVVNVFVNQKARHKGL